MVGRAKMSESQRLSLSKLLISKFNRWYFLESCFVLQLWDSIDIVNSLIVVYNMSLKDKGNELFRTGKFEEAVKCYELYL